MNSRTYIEYTDKTLIRRQQWWILCNGRKSDTANPHCGNRLWLIPQVLLLYYEL